MALMLQHQAQRQALLVAQAKKRYQDYDQDSLDLDDLDDKFEKYADLLKADGGAAKAGAVAQQQPQTQQQQQQQPQVAPPAATRAPASYSDFGEDFGFDETWGGRPSNGGGGGGGGYYSNNNNNNNSYGGYYNNNNSGYGAKSGAGYAGGSYGAGVFEGWGDLGLGGSGGFGGGGGGGYGAGGYVNVNSGRQRTSSRYRTSFEFVDDDEIDELDGEAPVVKVDKCVVNGKMIQCNHGITVPQVFLLGLNNDRNPLGVMPTSRAQALADEAKEDLMLLNPDASPPVARVIKWDKYKYEQERATKEKKAKSTNTETKEVRMRPSTGTGDIETKLKSCKKFLSKGDRVKLVMKFEGREVQFKEQGKEVLLNFISELASVAKVEGPLNFKTGTYTILLAPKLA